MALGHSYGKDFSNICQEDVTVCKLHLQPFAKQRGKDKTGAGAGKEPTTQFTPLFVRLDVDVSNYMDVCKFYPKFAEERSHSEREREKNHIISVYVITFYQNYLCV